MRHERATEELRELAALHALGSLTQHEARSFELHIKEGCSACETEFRKFEQAVSGIGLAGSEAAVPLGRWGNVREISDACLFITSEASRFTTGAILVVDGGAKLSGAMLGS